uniref:Uncharacterized protein n=1 Tax=Oryza glumipatula TaxID=40148 RepID=A0A0E0AKK2_9ORYZ
MATSGDLMRKQLFLAEVVHLVPLLVWGRRPELRVDAGVEEEDGETPEIDENMYE